MSIYKYILLFIFISQFFAEEDFFYDALGAPKCEEGETNCKRVSDRRKKKQMKKQNQVITTRQIINKFIELPSDDPEQIKLVALMQWLKAGGAEMPKMDMIFFYKNYRGAITTRKVFQGDTLLFVPYRLLITYETSLAISSLARRLEQKKLRLYNLRHSIIAMAILEQKEEPNAFWKPYIDIMPDSYHEYPLMFDESDMANLQNSTFKEDTQFQQNEYRNDYNKILEAMPDFSEFSYQEFTWARLVVQSRIFGVTVDGQSTQAMVPFADMLNHARIQPTEWSYNQPRQGFVITAKEDIEKGMEVYDTYGRKTNRMFYMNYGFIEDGNDMNIADIYTCISSRDILYIQKFKQLGWKQCLNFKLQNQTIDQSMNEALAISRFLIIDNIFDFYRFEKAIGKKSYTKTPALSVEQELAALEKLIQLITTQFEEYPTTIEEDQKLIDKMVLERNWKMLNIYNLRKLEKQVMVYFIRLSEFLINLYQQPIETPENLKQRIERREPFYSNLGTYLTNVYGPLMRGEKP